PGVGGRDLSGREQPAACPEPKRKHSGRDWTGVRAPGRGQRVVGPQDTARCSPETDCDLCVRVAVHLAVHGYWEEPEDEEKFGIAEDPEMEEPRNVFDCFEAALGAEVRIWSYTQPQYQKELNLTQQLPALPGLNVSADGDDVRLVLDVPEEMRFGLSLYWNQVPGPAKPWWHRNLTGPQNITLNHTDLVPCLCIQVWPLEPDSVRTSICPFREDSLGPLKDDMLLVETRGPQDNRSLCALESSGCTPLLSRASTRAARLGGPLLQDVQSGQCLQLWDDDLGALWACPMEKCEYYKNCPSSLYEELGS
ncbi:hypothetical protein E2I00_000802, partial [Balaenoptera physalus]